MSAQIQPNGLSPRASKGTRGHRRARSATNADFCGSNSSSSNSSSSSSSSSSKISVTPTPSTQHGHFFNNPVPSARPPYSGGNNPFSRLPALEEPSASTAVSTEEAPSSCKGNNKQPVQQATVFHLVAMVATALVVCLCIRTAANPGSNRAVFLRAATRTATAVAEKQDRCTKVQGTRNLSIPGDRNQCASVLPASVVEEEALSWLVSVHIDRTPSMEPAKRLRGAARAHRSLPHQYYVRAMEASLHSISKAEPGATVDVAVFSEGGQWGGMVDEMGVPLDWDVPGDICEDLGLHCTQSLVLLSGQSPSVAEALECVTASDVLVASEGTFSRAAVALSNHVKVLTDEYGVDEDEMMVVLNPARTIAGMPASQRKLLQTLVADYHECGPLAA